MITWCQSNNDDYPLPSRLDKFNWTVPEDKYAKNATANIYSIMIFNGALSPDIFISPLETNPSVVSCEIYQYESPKAAVDPSKAMWDPAFSVALDGSAPGNASYAHLQPSDGRLDRFRNTFVETEMILINRGPEIAAVTQNAGASVTPFFANPKSNTLRFFGKTGAWSGNAAFNDNHVDFMSNALAHGRPVKSWSRGYDAADGVKRTDLWFYDEPDDPKAGNDYLGIFLKAGEKREDFKAAWD